MKAQIFVPKILQTRSSADSLDRLPHKIRKFPGQAGWGPKARLKFRLVR